MWPVLRKDLLIELRTGEIVTSISLLSLLILLTFAFALEPERLASAEAVAGLAWATLLLAGTLALNRSFLLEREAGGWTALAVAPVDRGSIFLGKTSANALLLLLGSAVALPLPALLVGPHGLAPGQSLLLTVPLGVTGIAAVGTLFSAMAIRTRAREVLLPLLLFPLLTPVIIAATRATAGGLSGESVGDLAAWLLLLAAFDVIFVTVGWLTFEYVLED